MTTTLPYGSWPSPISAAELAEGGVALGAAALVEDGAGGRETWWSEGIASEDGRIAVVREGEGPDPVTVLPAPWNARSRVHEYGGGAWTVVPEHAGDTRALVFVNFADQRVYRLGLDEPGAAPFPLTPSLPEVAAGPALRFACPAPSARPGELLWVCEDHTRTGEDGEPAVARYVVAVPLDGSAAEDAQALRQVTPAAGFTAYPAISPDRDTIAWITWEHPQMPWDGTTLWVADLVDGVAARPRAIAGGETESVLQPEWLTDRELVFVSDRSGWWNPMRATFADPAGSPSGNDPAHPQPRPAVTATPLLRAEREFADAMWMVGDRWFAADPASRTLVTRSGGAAERLSVLDVDAGTLADLDLPHTAFSGVARDGDRVVTVAASPTAPPAVLEIDLASARVRTVRSSRSSVPDPGALPAPEEITVPGPDGDVHAVLFRPRLDGYAGPEGETPPFVAFVHGGPTAKAPAALSLKAAYYTSRGIGCVEINYGGSTGYGRAYRERLKTQWGVVDVADTVAVMEHLVARGIADRDRLGIEGGSAGGWTTLACLTRTDTFDAGVSSFGVAELEQFVADTHDFESRYIDGLIGPLPEARDLYRERAPLHHVDELDCPVLLLQGDEDRIVPPSQSEMFRDALAAKGIPHAYLLFEGEQHGFRGRDSIVRAREASLAFYAQIFGFETDVPALDLS